ncbi:hypothetical protein H8S90_08445 [Olivibacter sp. SDN3]|nr:hypothetical protein H8S90_08445 [Olivibacter sp. SDN3]
MNKREIFFIDPFMMDAMHAPFNAAMLQVIAQLYPKYRLTVYTHSSHYRYLQGYGDIPAQVHHQPIWVLPFRTGNKFWWLCKLLVELCVITRLLIRARRRQTALVYFAFLSPIGQYLVSFYSRYVFRKQHLLVQLHGLDILTPAPHQKKIDRIYAWFIKKAFAFRCTHKRYLVMEKSAMKFLLHKGYLSSDTISYAPHPYHFVKQQPVESRPSHPLVFAHLGIARLSKQSHLFFKLAAAFSEDISQGRVIFRLVGQVLPEMAPYLNDFVERAHTTDMLSPADYREALSTAHYAIFCYDVDGYELTSSGAVMDAIAARIPMLAIQNSLFLQLFNQSKEPPGILYPSYEDLQEGLKKLIAQHQDIYPRFLPAFDDLQHYYSIDHVVAYTKEAIAGWEDVHRNDC